MRGLYSMLPAALLITGCPGVGPIGDEIRIDTDFRDGAQGWTALFADYAEAQETDLELAGEVAPLPAELDADGAGFLLGGNNRSDDLAMLLVRRLTTVEHRIVPGGEYEVAYRIVFASNAPSGCSGIGGAPGEGVTLKAGASGVEPKAEVNDAGDVRLNIDIGAQANGGDDATVVDNVANGLDCDEIEDLGDAPYLSLTRVRTHAAPVRASSTGELWLVVGTDSGFEGRTELFYQRIEVTLTRVE
jgi:hypothetical protein